MVAAEAPAIAATRAWCIRRLEEDGVEHAAPTVWWMEWYLCGRDIRRVAGLVSVLGAEALRDYERRAMADGPIRACLGLWDDEDRATHVVDVPCAAGLGVDPDFMRWAKARYRLRLTEEAPA